MTTFKKLSKIYDTIYSDKDYNKETNYVYSLINEYHPHCLSAIDYGCGTGKFTYELEFNCSMEGVDSSKEMLKIAKKRTPNITYHHSKIKDFKSEYKRGIALALFHVIDYITTDEEIKESLDAINQILVNDGLLIFDFWYKPAVLHLKPEFRIKECNGITRIAKPTLIKKDHLVKVKYTYITKKETFVETHTMRYFSKREIKKFLKRSGFKVLQMEEWLTKKRPSRHTWGVCVVCQKVKK
jgi:SAM-dependent methyltransferase